MEVQLHVQGGESRRGGQAVERTEGEANQLSSQNHVACRLAPFSTFLWSVSQGLHATVTPCCLSLVRRQKSKLHRSFL